MAIEPVNERPIFPALIRADSAGVGTWSVSMIRQLTTVFQQYGYRLNKTLLTEDLAAEGGTIAEIDEAQTWTATQTFTPVQVFSAAPTATGHPLRFNELAENGGSIPETDRANAFAAGQTQDGDAILDEGTSGVIIQNKFASTGAVVSTTTAIPFDDTIPQITEGAEALSIAFTPKRADSRIRVSASLMLTVSVVNKVRTVAVFSSTQTGALAVSAGYADASPPAPGTTIVSVVADIASSSTSARTFSVRFGANDTNTIYLNAISSGSRLYGGVSASTLEIMEYMP